MVHNAVGFGAKTGGLGTEAGLVPKETVGAESSLTSRRELASALPNAVVANVEALGVQALGQSEHELLILVRIADEG